MKSLKRGVYFVLIILILLTNLHIDAAALTDKQIESLERILGVYEGRYTAPQGLTGLTLSIYRTKDLISDDVQLQKFADIATSCRASAEEDTVEPITIDDIRTIVSKHTDDYIAIFNYYPLVNAETGVGPNPDVEEGLYTMTVSYNESSGKYSFTGSEWIQHDTYVFADLVNISLSDDVLLGDVYGEYASLLWTEYGDIGDVSVSSGKSQAGYRIELGTKAMSFGVNEKQQIFAVVRDGAGVPSEQSAAIRWFSNDADIAQISGEDWGGAGCDFAVGTIIGVSEGITEVYAELENNRVASCKVVVSQNGTMAPLEIETSYELVSQIISSKEGEITTYKFAPNYNITATIKNPDVHLASDVIISIILPDRAAIYGDYRTSLDNIEIDAGDSVTVSWSILTEGDYNSITNVQYAISAESDRCAEIKEYKTIFVEPFVGQDNRIKYDKDVWNFINSDAYFNKGHFISSEYYDYLINSVSNVEREHIDDYLNCDWNGSCYGMSAISCLSKLGHINPKDYYSDAEVLKDLPSPDSSDDIYSLITYYHMTQKSEAYYAEILKNYSMDESQKLIELVNAVEKVKIGGTPVVIGISFMEEDFDLHSIKDDYFTGHAILAYDVEYGKHSVNSIVDGKKYEYDKKIKIYDPNDNKTPIYMHINSDYSAWIVDGYCQSRTKNDGLYWYKGEGNFTFLSDANNLDPINIRDSRANYVSRIIANENTRLRIKLKDDGGESGEFRVHGINILDNTNTDVIAYSEAMNGEGYSSSFGYMIDNDFNEIIVFPEDEASGIDVEYCFDGVSLAAECESSQSVAFSEDRAITLECSGEYSLSATYNETGNASSWFNYNVQGDSSGAVRLFQDDEGYTVISGDDLGDINISVQNSSGVQSRKLSTDEKKVRISGDNALVFLIDADNNGTFETNIDRINITEIYKTDIAISSISIVIASAAITLIILLVLVIVIIKRAAKRKK